MNKKNNKIKKRIFVDNLIKCLSKIKNNIPKKSIISAKKLYAIPLPKYTYNANIKIKNFLYASVYLCINICKDSVFKINYFFHKFIFVKIKICILYSTTKLTIC